MEGEVKVDDRPVPVRLGLRRVEELLALADRDGRQLFLERSDQAATPLLPSDHILVRGGERLTHGSVASDPNPRLPHPVRPTLNGEAIALQTAKVTGGALKENDSEFPNGRLFVESVGDTDLEVPDEATLVVQDADAYFVVPASPESGDAVDVEECRKHGRRPPRGNHTYRIRIDTSKYSLESRIITGTELLALVDKNYHDWSLNKKLHGGRRQRVRPADVIDLCVLDVERFETVRLQAQQGHG